MDKVLLFGASSYGLMAYDSIKHEKKIIGFIDNDKQKWGKELNGVKIYSPDYIYENNFEVIITSAYYKEISEQLNNAQFFNYSIYRMYYEKNTLHDSETIINTLPVISLGHLIENLGPVEINSVSFLHGGSLLTDYLLLRGLVQQFNAKTYLEIGTWTGESLMSVHQIVDKSYSISLPDDDELLVNIFDRYCNKANFSRYFSKGKDNIVSFYEDSLKFDYSRIGETIDLVFIDGDHSFNGVYKDTSNIFNYVGYENTIVVWHDFKTNTNQLICSTFDAVRKALPEKYHKNLFSVDTSISGVYIPEKFQDKIKINEDRNELYSYSLKVDVKKNELK